MFIACTSVQSLKGVPDLILAIKHVFCVCCRYECSINQEKASEKRDEIKEGMKDVTDKLAEINENKKAKGKELKKISK